VAGCNVWHVGLIVRGVLHMSILPAYDALRDMQGMSHYQIRELVACYFDGGLSRYTKPLQKRYKKCLSTEEAQEARQRLINAAAFRAYPRDKGLAMKHVAWPDDSLKPVVEYAIVRDALKVVQQGMSNEERQQLRRPVESIMRWEQQTAHMLWERNMLHTWLKIMGIHSH